MFDILAVIDICIIAVALASTIAWVIDMRRGSSMYVSRGGRW